MYRFACILLCLCLLTSCSVRSTSPVVSGFRCRVECSLEGVSVAAELDRTDPANTTLTFSQPQELQGLTMLYDGQTVRLEYLGVEMDVPAAYLPQCSVIRTLADALNAATASHAPTQAGGLVFDEESGLPRSLVIDEPPMTFFFSDWELPLISTNKQ